MTTETRAESEVMTHDYDYALKFYKAFMINNETADVMGVTEAIIHALRVAQRLQMEPSEGMIAAVTPAVSDWIGHPEAPEESKQRWCRGYADAAIQRFKSMVSELYREIEGEIK